MPKPELFPFDTLEPTFRLLSEGSSPLAVVGRELHPSLPDQLLTPIQLRKLLLNPRTRYEARDAVAVELVRRARAHGGAWTAALAGVLLPGLRRAISPLRSACPDKAADLQGETLAGLLTVLERFDPTPEHRASWLVLKAKKRAQRLLVTELSVAGRREPMALGLEPRRPWGHPDLVLCDAVKEGVISAEEAELIGETRLGDISLHRYAEEVGIAYLTIRLRRFRAEQRLVPWVRDREVLEELR
ncbi:MAG: hypothetical protein ACRDHY_16885 [Anaerolineales bacterium]